MSRLSHRSRSLLVMFLVIATACDAMIFNPPDPSSLSSFHAHRKMSQRITRHDAARMLSSEIRQHLLWRGADRVQTMRFDRTREDLLQELDEHLQGRSPIVVSADEQKETMTQIERERQRELDLLPKAPKSTLQPGFDTPEAIARAKKQRVIRRKARLWLARSGFPTTMIYTGRDKERLAKMYDSMIRETHKDRKMPLTETFDDYPVEPSIQESAHDPRPVSLKHQPGRIFVPQPFHESPFPIERSGHSASHTPRPDL